MLRVRIAFVYAAILVGLSALSPSAHAVAVDFSQLGIDPNSLIDPTITKALVSVIGFGTQHRPYEPATPLSMGSGVGLDVSLEVTLFKIPDSFFSSLSSFGLPATSPLPALPVAKLHMHKGMGDFVDLGGSFLWLKGNWFVGSDIKIALLRGEEGPTYAFRFCYSYTKLAFNQIALTTKTFSPQLLVSRKMEFADPYLGVAAAYTRGNASVTLSSANLPASAQAEATALGVSVDPSTFDLDPASAYTGYAFGGVSLKVPHSGLRITLEGAYDLSGVSTMGTKIGFTF